MTVRLPSCPDYAEQVEKEQYWLPKLAPYLPLPIATPIAMGKSDVNYPLPWSIYKWLEGEAATTGQISDLYQFARDLAKFLATLQQCDTTEGPVAGTHNFYRGGDLAVYDSETRAAINTLEDRGDVQAITTLWDEALASAWKRPPVWVHGDIATGNLLVKDGILSAVIDFGQLGIGDPACDLVIAWTFFTEKSREVFRASLPFDQATWTRACGWALWKALCSVFPGSKGIDWRVINEILLDHRK